jgi:hypothetical protein
VFLFEHSLKQLDKGLDLAQSVMPLLHGAAGMEHKTKEVVCSDCSVTSGGGGGAHERD